MQPALKSALTGLAAASIEWYDFFLYATAAALVFPTVFFAPTLPPYVAQLASFSSFAVGFVARPLGAMLFGHLGDRLGRKPALSIALVTMGVATSLIGCLPSYRTAGIFSSLALAVLRIAQGLAVGGQWGGAILLATENAPPLRRALYGSIAQAGVPVGVLLSNVAFFIVNRQTSSEAFLAYGWRILFLLSLALIVLALFIHLRLQDTAAFRALKQSAAAAASEPRGAHARSPVLEALRLHPRSILLAAGAFLSTNLTFYILITYIVAYGTSSSGLNLPRGLLLEATLISNSVALPMMFLAGICADRFGRRRVFGLGLVFSGVWAFALFPLTNTGSLLWISVAVGGGMAGDVLTYGPLAALFAGLFATEVRYSAVSLAYQLGAIIGGGFAPMIATGLYARYHSNLPIALYMTTACACSFLCLLALKETRAEPTAEARAIAA
jgi:MFS family permease